MNEDRVAVSLGWYVYWVEGTYLSPTEGQSQTEEASLGSQREGREVVWVEHWPLPAGSSPSLWF